MRLVLPLAASLAGVVFVVGCSVGGTDKEDAPVAGGVAGGAVFVKEGRFGGTGAPLHARVQIKGVERRGEKSVLRYSVTSMDSSKKSLNIAIDLLDPAGRLLYKSTGSTGGETFEPGATREMTAEYPAIPRSVAKVTAITRSTAGEFTGIPVTGPDDPSAASLARLRGNPVELYGITEGEDRDVAASGHRVTLGLHTDALFEKTSADLAPRAGEVLDETAREIKATATGSLTFEGHTDSRGDDSANVELSKERAEAVMREMKSRLGDGFTYTASGRGDAEPIAAEGGEDDAMARKRNRRVEITYEVKRPETPSPSAADFRPQDGKKIASRSAKFGEAKRRLDVKPFYRDGAYIVAVFDIVNEGPEPTPPDTSYAHRDYPGGVFTSFSIRVPGSKDVYRTVRIGTVTPGATGSYIDPGRAVFGPQNDQPVRGFAYLPAPPGDVPSVTFDAGPFGEFREVPVRQGG